MAELGVGFGAAVPSALDLLARLQATCRDAGEVIEAKLREAARAEGLHPGDDSRC